jgi:hypothetical protein
MSSASWAFAKGSRRVEVAQYEYRILRDYSIDRVEEDLNGLAEQGWEIETAQSYIRKDTPGLFIVMKRKVPVQQRPVARAGSPRPAQ